MKAVDFVAKMTDSPLTIRSRVGGLSDEDARWKPAPDKWSVLEVINHMHDEEVEDFRVRVESTAHDPAIPWPSIAPETWVTERAYNKRELAESLDRFAAERKKSIDVLMNLGDVDWDNAYQHPQLGALRAGDLMLSWFAHDYLHIRQLSALIIALAARDSQPYNYDYAAPEL